ncbi:MAG: hypothetical protein ACOYMW_04880 [Candidatus Competibacteraceae bacterium]|jgi:hypothetical protein
MPQRSRFSVPFQRRKLTSIENCYHAETGPIIHDEYVWRENGLFTLSRTDLMRLLIQQRAVT